MYIFIICIHLCADIYKLMHVSYAHAYPSIYTCACLCTYTFTFSYALTHAYMYTLKDIHMNTYVQVRLKIHTHTYTYTIHKYDTHMCILPCTPINIIYA